MDLEERIDYNFNIVVDEINQLKQMLHYVSCELANTRQELLNRQVSAITVGATRYDHHSATVWTLYVSTYSTYEIDVYASVPGMTSCFKKVEPIIYNTGSSITLTFSSPTEGYAIVRPIDSQLPVPLYLPPITVYYPSPTTGIIPCDVPSAVPPPMVINLPGTLSQSGTVSGVTGSAQPPNPIPTKNDQYDHYDNVMKELVG